MPTLEQYREALRERVCSVCTDRNVDGSCGIEAGHVCPFDAHLPRIVEAISKVDSDNIADYERVIREQVCQNCYQDEDGTCSYRKTVSCGLDAYVLLVIAAIDDLNKKSA